MMAENDENYDDDMDEISADDRTLLKTIHERGIPASAVTTRIKGAVQGRSASAPRTVPAKPAATRQDVEKLAAESEQRTRARELYQGIRSVVRDVADKQGFPSGKQFRQGVVQSVMEAVDKREDIAALDEESFETVVRETAAKVVEEAGKELVTAAATMAGGNGKPPTGAKKDEETPVKTPAKSDAAVVGQTPAGETPPRSEVKSTDTGGDPRRVTHENLDRAFAAEGMTWPHSDKAVELETSRAAMAEAEAIHRSGE